MSRPAKCRLLLAAALIAAALMTISGAEAAEEFYVRAGIGLERPTDAAFMDEDCSSASPDALYGCGTGGDGAPRRSLGGFGTATGVELGLGLNAAPAVRIEALVDYRPRFTFEGRANFLAPERRQSVSADLSVLSGMVAAHVDLSALGLPRLGPLDPFAGAGIGAARIRIAETSMTFPRTTTIVPGTQRTGLAWMVTAGMSAPLGARTWLDLAWRYTDLGTVETGTGMGRVVWRDGGRPPLPLDLAATRATLRSHGLRLSLRYVF